MFGDLSVTALADAESESGAADEGDDEGEYRAQNGQPNLPPAGTDLFDQLFDVRESLFQNGDFDRQLMRLGGEFTHLRLE